MRVIYTDRRMHLPTKTLTCFLVVGLSGYVFSSCSGKEVDENDPAAMLKEAEEDVSSDHYQMALDKLRAIKNKFPYSKESVEAQLRIADVYFMQESFSEAALAYETFRDLHPKHEKTPYAMFRIGKSHFSDHPGTIARDLGSLQKALDAYTEFTKRFPTAKESDEARKDATEAKGQLAEKELYIANFYMKRDDPASAKGRLEKIVEKYRDTPSFEEAKRKLADIVEQGIKRDYETRKKRDADSR